MVQDIIFSLILESLLCRSFLCITMTYGLELVQDIKPDESNDVVFLEI